MSDGTKIHHTFGCYSVQCTVYHIQCNVLYPSNLCNLINGEPFLYAPFHHYGLMALRSTIGEKIWPSIHPRDFGSGNRPYMVHTSTPSR